ARQVAEQVERRALGGEQQARRRFHAGQICAAFDLLAVVDEVGELAGIGPAHGIDHGSGDREPGDRARTAGTERCSAGTVATEVTSMPPARSSLTAMRTSAATASASTPRSTSWWRVASP